jgi:hypothetical protein
MSMHNAILIAPLVCVLLGVVPAVFAQSDTQPTCPSGYSLSSDGTTCNLDQSQQQSQQPTCPSGYSLSSDGTTCNLDQSQQQQQQQQSSQPTCPSGYSLSSDQTKCVLDKKSLDLSPLAGPALCLGVKVIFHVPC